MTKRIAIIGAGQLGSRHLQALKKVDFPASIEVVDKNSESLRLAKQRYEEIPDNINIKSIAFYLSIDDLCESIDLCIISTNADIRAKICEELTNKKRVKNFIFEKILFQTLEDYYLIDNILKKENIKAFVNCPRRYYPIYQKFKEMLGRENPVSIHAQTGDTGIITGGIHLLDLLVYLNNNSPIVSSVNFLNDTLIPTKRDGFFEVTGAVSFELKNGARIILSSQEIPNAPNSIDINSPNHFIVVREETCTAMISSREKNWEKEIMPFNIIYQSNLTHIVAKDILINNSCQLTSFDDSFKSI